MKILFLLILIPTSGLFGCNFLDFTDPVQIQSCCDCLANHQRPQSDAGVGTFDVSIDELSLCIDGSDDCLCGESADSCFQKLKEDRAPVALLGACTAPGGPCEPACRSVLVFEPASLE